MMKDSWGTVQHFLGKRKRLWKLSNFIGPSIKFTLVLLSFQTGVVSPCPLLSLVASDQLGHNIDNGDPSHHHEQRKREATTVNFDSFHNDKRAILSSPTFTMLVTFVTTIAKFLVKSLMGDQWLSEDVALERLDELKTSLFKHYARQNLFGGTVEQARDGGIGFPSLEGALLSLAFLTFSVFLIDLIQTILNRLRLRNTTTAAPTGAIIGRAFSPPNFQSNANSTHPMSVDTLTTLSSKVFSAIEKPWKFGSSSTSSVSSTSSSSTTAT